MRISTIAGLLILTTMALATTACSQSQMAEVIDHSGQSYGWKQAGVTITPLVAQQRFAQASYKPAPEVASQRYDETPHMVATSGMIESRELSAPSVEVKPAQELASGDDIFITSSMDQLRWPVQGRVIRAFGEQASGIKSEGIAIATPYGMPIRAANDGEVAYVGSGLKDFGNMLIMRHADGSMTSYAHASEIVVKKGDAVQRGALLGYVGRSGNVAEPQLAFTMRVGNQTVDPLRHLPQQLASVH